MAGLLATIIGRNLIPLGLSSNLEPNNGSGRVSVRPFGYEVSFPSDLKVESGQQIVDLVIPFGYFRTSAIKEAEIELSPGAKKCDSFSNHIKQRQKMMINGMEFERHVWSGEAAGNIFQGVDYNLLKDGLCYQVRLYTHSVGAGSLPAAVAKDPASVHYEDMERVFVLADGIASSFRFTNFK
ncbi:MAG: hypothetical protein HYV68_00085 [Candidatus Taylorbacteria bacterium]|nr:hypothetical protein [Candidatus Taylorbacteria bacterium]